MIKIGPPSTDTKIPLTRTHLCIRCRQKWRQNFKNPSFEKGFENGFSKSVLFWVSWKIPFADLSKSRFCRHFVQTNSNITNSNMSNSNMSNSNVLICSTCWRYMPRCFAPLRPEGPTVRARRADRQRAEAPTITNNPHPSSLNLSFCKTF
jgi:hypothetical protein